MTIFNHLDAYYIRSIPLPLIALFVGLASAIYIGRLIKQVAAVWAFAYVAFLVVFVGEMLVVLFQSPQAGLSIGQIVCVNLQILLIGFMAGLTFSSYLFRRVKSRS